MAWNHRNLRQKITYWAPGTPDGFGGIAYVAPVEFKGRWEDRLQIVTDFAGNEKISKAVVYLDSDVVVRGYLFEGVSSSTDPSTVVGAKEIVRIDKTPTLNAQFHERKVFL